MAVRQGTRPTPNGHEQTAFEQDAEEREAYEARQQEELNRRAEERAKSLDSVINDLFHPVAKKRKTPKQLSITTFIREFGGEGNYPALETLQRRGYVFGIPQLKEDPLSGVYDPRNMSPNRKKFFAGKKKFPSFRANDTILESLAADYGMEISGSMDYDAVAERAFGEYEAYLEWKEKGGLTQQEIQDEYFRNKEIGSATEEEYRKYKEAEARLAYIDDAVNLGVMDKDTAKMLKDTIAFDLDLIELAYKIDKPRLGSERFSITSPVSPTAEEIAQAQREYDEVVARYTNPDGTKKPGWMKAPNGKPTNLVQSLGRDAGERAWVQIQTPNFRANYFGFYNLPKHQFNIVTAESAPFNNTKAALVWAKANGIVGLMTNEETNGKGEINISANSINEMLNPKQRGKSVSNAAHYAALTKLRDIIRESELVDRHPDYKKGADGKRSPENGINPGVTIDVLYGAFRFRGELCRVKATLKRFAQEDAKTKAYAYEVSEIEVLPGTLAQPKTGPGPRGSTSILGSILLQGARNHKGNLILEDFSKVVDENGDPFVVFHGTNNEETRKTWNPRTRTFDIEHSPFTVFRRRVDGVRNSGAFFNSSEDNAGGYGSRVYKVFLNLRNPLVIDANNSDYSHITHNGATRDTYEWAERNGYDGLIIKNLRDGVDYGAMSSVTADYVAFRPSQIKSATDNTGAFDSGNADIRFSIGGVYTGSAADYANKDENGNIVNGPSLHHIGTGEGSQVYGWGLYGSTVRGVAEGYAEAGLQKKHKITHNGKVIQRKANPATPKELAEAEMISAGDVKSVASSLAYTANFKKGKEKALYRAAAKYAADHADEYKRAGGEHIYEQTFFTDRAPGDERHLLKWYEPVSERQKNLLEDALSKNGVTVRRVTTGPDYDRGTYYEKDGKLLVMLRDQDAKLTGELAYQLLSKDEVLGSPKAASEWLAAHDIDGIKYPVDSYGGKGVKDGDKAGWNYVSFRDDNIRVDHKWVDGEQRYSIATLGKYDTDDLRSLAHRVKDGDAEAIAEAGRRLAVILPPDAVLVPMPSHTGEPTTMRLIADAIAANANGAKVVDALRSNAHESNYAQKKRGEEPAGIEMRKVANIPENAEVYIVDNVIDTGATYSAAMKAIPNAHILALADTDRTPEELRFSMSVNPKLGEDIREAADFDKANYTELSSVVALTQAMRANDEKTVAGFRGRHFRFAKTNDTLKDIGLSGDYFTVRAGVILRHNGKDAAHNITPDEWRDIADALTNREPEIVERFGDRNGQYRIWTQATIGGRTAIIGAEVKNVGRDIDINAVQTVFGAGGAMPKEENIVYPKSIEEIRSVLTRHNSGRYPESPQNPNSVSQTGAVRNSVSAKTNPRTIDDALVALTASRILRGDKVTVESMGKIAGGDDERKRRILEDAKKFAADWREKTKQDIANRSNYFRIADEVTRRRMAADWDKAILPHRRGELDRTLPRRQSLDCRGAIRTAKSPSVRWGVRLPCALSRPPCQPADRVLPMLPMPISMPVGNAPSMGGLATLLTLFQTDGFNSQVAKLVVPRFP